MLLLASTSDAIRVVTSAAVTVDVQASWVDLSAGVTTPGRTNSLITTATTTAVVGSPAASTYRTVKSLAIRNRHATASCIVTVIHRASGPTDSELIQVTLTRNHSLIYDEHLGFRVVRAPYGDICTISTTDHTTQVVGALHASVLQYDVVNANATANRNAEIRALGFPVKEGQSYWFNFLFMFTAAATTTGSRFGIYGPTEPGALRMLSEISLTTTTKTNNEGLTSYDNPDAASATSAATGSNIARIVGFLDPATGDGMIYALFASEIAGSAITVKAGSTLRWARVI